MSFCIAVNNILYIKQMLIRMEAVKYLCQTYFGPQCCHFCQLHLSISPSFLSPKIEVRISDKRKLEHATWLSSRHLSSWYSLVQLMHKSYLTKSLTYLDKGKYHTRQI